MLSTKLCLVFLLLSGQRVQAVQAFNIDNIQLNDTKCILYINKIFKTSKPGRHKSYVEFNCYSNENLCVVCHLRKYLELTSDLRGTEKQLFIALNKPHKAVSVDTLSRWTKSMLQKSGIDITTFSTHSTRSASTSKGFDMGIPISEILAAASWTNAKTFAMFYNKPIVEDSYDTKLLKSIYSSTHNK